MNFRLAFYALFLLVTLVDGGMCDTESHISLPMPAYYRKNKVIKTFLGVSQHVRTELPLISHYIALLVLCHLPSHCSGRNTPTPNAAVEKHTVGSVESFLPQQHCQHIFLTPRNTHAHIHTHTCTHMYTHAHTHARTQTRRLADLADSQTRRLADKPISTHTRASAHCWRS